ncbi:MAG: 4-hydroxy-3-methylbut-2-enyl diphosphate reductase [Oscillospiraceae bacterium]|nr:4-hydroxy-3-methylbut-2-enyl diphosphate reductase [Oscillospiraceae bacterium]
MTDRIKIGKSAGFCFGVKNAVDAAYSNANNDKPIYTYGKIIHNDYVVDDLKRRNVPPISDPAELPENATVIIRAHGIAPNELALLRHRGAKIIDATCPYVAKIHEIVSEDYKLGRQIIIAGDENHPEVKGINGYCDNTAWIVNAVNPQSAELTAPLPKEPNNPITIVSQTTMRQDIYKQIVKFFKKRFTDVKIYDTICSATINRQTEGAEIARNSDVCIVIGGASSSNTNKLFEVCKQHCEHTFQIENAAELDKIKKFINKNTIVGITAGASTPAEIIEEVVSRWKR